MFTASAYLFEILSYNRKHGTSHSLDITQAMVIDENPDKRNFKLDQKMRFFIGKHYDEIVKLYNNEGYPKFCDIIDRGFSEFETPEVTAYDKPSEENEGEEPKEE